MVADDESRVYAVLPDVTFVPTYQLVKQVGMDTGRAYYALQRLVALGKAERVKQVRKGKPGRPALLYRRVPA